MTAAQASSQAKPTAAVFDLDHTITSCDTYARFLLGLAVRRPQRWLKCLPLPIEVFRVSRGYKNNHWLKERALTAIAASLEPARLKSYCAVLENDILDSHLRPGARAVIAGHREKGHRLILASASFDFYVEALAKRLGFEEVICTSAEKDSEGRITGRIAGQNCYGDEKLRRVARLFGEERQNWHTVVYTDHHTDLPLLEWADQGRIVHPSKRLRAAADKCGYEVLDWS